MLGMVLATQALVLSHFFLASGEAQDFTIAVLQILHISQDLLFGPLRNQIITFSKIFLIFLVSELNLIARILLGILINEFAHRRLTGSILFHVRPAF